MVATACRLNPKLDFRQGDFFGLTLDDGALAGGAVFYCLTVGLPTPDAPDGTSRRHRTSG